MCSRILFFFLNLLWNTEGDIAPFNSPLPHHFTSRPCYQLSLNIIYCMAYSELQAGGVYGRHRVVDVCQTLENKECSNNNYLLYLYCARKHISSLSNLMCRERASKDTRARYYIILSKSLIRFPLYHNI